MAGESLYVSAKRVLVNICGIMSENPAPSLASSCRCLCSV